MAAVVHTEGGRPDEVAWFHGYEGIFFQRLGVIRASPNQDCRKTRSEQIPAYTDPRGNCPHPREDSGHIFGSVQRCLALLQTCGIRRFRTP